MIQCQFIKKFIQEYWQRSVDKPSIDKPSIDKPSVAKTAPIKRIRKINACTQDRLKIKMIWATYIDCHYLMPQIVPHSTFLDERLDLCLFAQNPYH